MPSEKLKQIIYNHGKFHVYTFTDVKSSQIVPNKTKPPLAAHHCH
jgi:hypothetical protein